MADPRSWRSVAIELGLRMENHARCEAHPPAEHDPECPFCLDRQAYRAFLDRSGREVGARIGAHRRSVR